MSIVPDIERRATMALDRAVQELYWPSQAGRDTHPEYQPTPALLEFSAVERTYGRWQLRLESKSHPGTAHEVGVQDGTAGPCDCTAAQFGRGCRHRRDAEALATALDGYLASLASIQSMYSDWTPECREDIAMEWARMEGERLAVTRLGYRLTGLVRCDQGLAARRG